MTFTRILLLNFVNAAGDVRVLCMAGDFHYNDGNQDNHSYHGNQCNHNNKGNRGKQVSLWIDLPGTSDIKESM